MNKTILTAGIFGSIILIGGIIIYNKYYKKQIDLMAKDAETQAEIDALKEQLKNAKNITVSKKISTELVKKTTTTNGFSNGNKVFASENTNMYFTPVIDTNYKTVKQGQEIGTFVKKHNDYLSLVKWDSNIGNPYGTGDVYEVYIPTKNLSKTA